MACFAAAGAQLVRQPMVWGDRGQHLGLRLQTLDRQGSTGVVTGAVNATDAEKDALTYTAATITTAKLTALGSNGSMTFTNGLLTAQTPAT